MGVIAHEPLGAKAPMSYAKEMQHRDARLRLRRNCALARQGDVALEDAGEKRRCGVEIVAESPWRCCHKMHAERSLQSAEFFNASLQRLLCRLLYLF